MINKKYEKYLLHNGRVIEKNFVNIETLWHGIENRKMSINIDGIYKMIYNDLMSRMWENQDEREYVFRNISDLPMPEITAIFFHDLEINFFTDWEEILDYMKTKVIPGGIFNAKHQKLIDFAERQSKKCDSATIKLKQIRTIPNDFVKAFNEIGSFTNIENIKQIKNIMISIGTDINYEYN